jgi:hypothetical protein
MYSLLKLLVESLQLIAKVHSISFHDFINELATRRRDKVLEFPGMIHAEPSLSLHPMDELGALELPRQFMQAAHLLFSDTVAQRTIIADNFSRG